MFAAHLHNVMGDYLSEDTNLREEGENSDFLEIININGLHDGFHGWVII